MPSPLLAFAMLLWVPLVGSQQSAESALLEWVAAGSTGFDSPVEIGETEFGRGLVLKRDVPKDSMLLFVPQSKALSLDSCSMEAAYKLALQSTIGEQNKYVLIAVVLVFERSQGAASPFAPYIAALPQESPPNLFSWSKDQLELGLELLGADKIPENAVRCPSELRNVLAALAANHSTWFDRLNWAKDVSGELATWACSMAFSRNFNGKLMPLVDMANHKFRVRPGVESVDVTFDPTCLPKYDTAKSKSQWEQVQACAQRTSGSGIGFMSTRPWQKGEQVTDFYGYHGNIYTLMIYGFADAGASAVYGQKLVLPLVRDQYEAMTQIFSDSARSQTCQDHSGDRYMSQACKAIRFCSKYMGLIEHAVTNGKVHFPQRLHYESQSGISEVLSDCIRVGSYFYSVVALERALAREGFVLYSEELIDREAQTDSHTKPDAASLSGGNWVSRDLQHFVAIGERCTSVHPDSRTMARVGEDTEWVSTVLINVARQEVSAASRCSSTMKERVSQTKAILALTSESTNSHDDAGTGTEAQSTKPDSPQPAHGDGRRTVRGDL